MSDPVPELSAAEPSPRPGEAPSPPEEAASPPEAPPAPELSPAELRAATLAAVRLRPGAKARVGILALASCGALSLACVLLALAYLRAGHEALALGVLVGHAGAQLVTCTWLVGAILTFDRPNDAFLQATLGLSPLRLILLAGVVGCALWLADPNPNALFFSLVGTHLAGHVIEALVLRRLRLEHQAPA